MASILVTGGTGRLGPDLVSRLAAAGHEVTVLSRQRREGPGFVTGDLSTGAGLEEAVRDADVVLHCASAPKGDPEATTALVGALRAAGRQPHLVYVSIVGVDRVGWGYMRSKLECERIVSASGLPWTILRATPFFELILGGARAFARSPFVVPVPAGFVVQPLDPSVVAARLAELAAATPAGRVPDLGGPEVLSFADVLRTYLRVRGRRRPVVPVRLPGLRAVRDGALLPVGGGTAVPGQPTWEDFLNRPAGAGSLVPPPPGSTGPSHDA